MAKRHGVGKSARSAVARLEEVVLASSGADAFELVLALAAARLFARKSGAKEEALGARAIRTLVGKTGRAWRWLALEGTATVPDDSLVASWSLVGEALARGAAGAGGPGEALDAIFEELVTRVGKGEKGQFFTPRHVVDLAVDALGLADGERVIDPACGSGAFLTHARAKAKVVTWGCDVDARAVRVAKLLAVASGESETTRVRADALAEANGRGPWPKRVDVVLTNPPFAGDVKRAGFEVADLVRRAERDAFFLEQTVTLLRPGGRLAIVLPHGKVGAPAWAPLRRWLVARARVFAVVSLPRETFLPHTSQRTVLLFAKKRAAGAVPSAGERVLFVASERAGKDAAGEPIFRGTDARSLDHDLAAVASRLRAFLAKEGFAG